MLRRCMRRERDVVGRVVYLHGGSGLVKGAIYVPLSCAFHEDLHLIGKGFGVCHFDA